MELNISLACLICDEPVRLNEIETKRFKYDMHVNSKICDKCKKAILHYRKELEEKANNGSNT